MHMRRSVPALRDRFICEGTAAEKIRDPGTSTLVKSHYSGIASLKSSYVQVQQWGTLWIQG